MVGHGGGAVVFLGLGLSSFAAAQRKELEVLSGGTAEVRVVLRRESIDMTIESEPAGAMVVLDGKPLGASPIKARVEPGRFHEVRVERPGMHPAVRPIPADQVPVRLKVRLFPVVAETGWLVVDSDAPAAVLLDGVDTGETTPTAEIPTAPGAHRITLQALDGARSKAFGVRVGEGETVHRMVPLLQPETE